MYNQKLPRLFITRLMLERNKYKLLLLGIWMVVLIIFLWLPRINLLAYILTQAPISLQDKISFFANDLVGTANSLNNPIILSTLLFSFLTALSVTLLVYMFRTARILETKAHTQIASQSGVAVTIFGSHLVSCGGTILLAPIFPALAGTGTVLGGRGVLVNIWLSTVANLIGVALVILAIHRTSQEISRMILSSAASSSNNCLS